MEKGGRGRRFVRKCRGGVKKDRGRKVGSEEEAKRGSVLPPLPSFSLFSVMPNRGGGGDFGELFFGIWVYFYDIIKMCDILQLNVEPYLSCGNSVSKKTCSPRMLFALGDKTGAPPPRPPPSWRLLTPFLHQSGDCATRRPTHPRTNYRRGNEQHSLRLPPKLFMIYRRGRDCFAPFPLKLVKWPRQRSPSKIPVRNTISKVHHASYISVVFVVHLFESAAI